MKKYAVVSAAAVLFIFASLSGVFSNDIIWDDIGRGNLNLRTALIDTDNPRIIYAGSSSAVLKTENAGETWKNILSIKGQNKAVNFVLFNPQDKNSLYAATGNGLFYSANQGRGWKRIFRGRNYLENECITLAVLPYGIYLGTKAGLFVSKDNGRSWHKETASLGTGSISAIAYDLKEPNSIHVAGADGVFVSMDSGQSWERVFIAHSPREADNDREEEAEEAVEESSTPEIRYLAIDHNSPNYLYLSSHRGVYRSRDKGKSWDLLTDFGLLNKEIDFLLISPESTIYAVTKSGIFEYTNERWHELSLGLMAEGIRFLALDNQGNLYAASDNGLFRGHLKYPVDESKGDLTSLYYEDEPEICEVQQAAIKYADVELSKIKDWRNKARIKAILPKLTLGLDRSKSTNYEIYTSVTTKYVYEGPYDESNGWDVTLSWDLSELIWNLDQTSIDVRSRLMVQLREDVLDGVTKLYFERIRVKMELDELSIEDRRKRFEKELRLKELTASLDALTGGYFSQHLKPKN